MTDRVMFAGRYTVTLDSKNRAILPVALRKLAEKELRSAPNDREADYYLTIFRDGCLRLYTYVGFHEELALMRRNRDRLPKGPRKTRAGLVIRKYVADAQALSLGEQGRLLLPAGMADAANLTKGNACLFVGSDHVIEIWEEGRYEEIYGNIEDAADLLDELTQVHGDEDEDADDDVFAR